MIKFFKEFFGFSRKEINGLLVFCILLTLIAFAPLINSYLRPSPQYDYSAFAAEVAGFRATVKQKPRFNNYPDYNDGTESSKAKNPAQLFSFNPNGLSEESWEQLGFSKRQIKVIKNYEAKGGKFYRKEDLKKIYSIKADQYAMLEPYISIPDRPYTSAASYKSFEKRIHDKKAISVIELNSTDSATLETIRGIGPAFASRIIKYRNRLGGFYKKEQLKEVYGLDSLYEKLQDRVSVNSSSIQLILVNTVSFAELKKHPYLTYKQMNAILQYRKQHGVYKSLNDLKGVAILNEEVLNKIAPYLAFN